MRKEIVLTFACVAVAVFFQTSFVAAANDCSFTVVGTLMTLNADCATVCDGGGDRLRGIMFEGASGSITYNKVLNVNQGPSGCQEGNGIEVRKAPFDGTPPDTVSVEISHNVILDYQKTGIVANGDVNVQIVHNQVGASATQAHLAANSMQLGFGAIGVAQHNLVDGNQWLGASDFAATAILIFLATGDVSKNNLGGNSDVGIYIQADNSTCDNNRVFDSGPDGPHGDFGIFSFGSDNSVTNNKIRGFDIPLDGVDNPEGGARNKVIPDPNGSNP